MVDMQSQSSTAKFLFEEGEAWETCWNAAKGEKTPKRIIDKEGMKEVMRKIKKDTEAMKPGEEEDFKGSIWNHVGHIANLQREVASEDFLKKASRFFKKGARDRRNRCSWWS